MLRLAGLILLALLIALGVKLWSGHGGVQDTRRLQQAVDEQVESNALLQARNEALRAQVQDLKEGDEAIEEQARSELGLIRPGETFYRVVDPRGKPVQDDD